MAERELSTKILEIISQLDVSKLNAAGLIVEEANPSDPHVRLRRGPNVLCRIYNEARKIIGFCTEDPKNKMDSANYLILKKIPVDYNPFSEGFYRFTHGLPPFNKVQLAYQKV